MDSAETQRAEKPLRVVQWATGTVGRSAMRAVIGHPDMELVGVRVFSEAKDGRDAGELCGLPPTGVVATRDSAELLALNPDCCRCSASARTGSSRPTSSRAGTCATTAGG